MNPKPPASDDLRMSAADFDKMMRGALSAQPEKKASPAPKRPTRPKRKPRK